jgi:hypothetical protein
MSNPSLCVVMHAIYASIYIYIYAHARTHTYIYCMYHTWIIDGVILYPSVYLQKLSDHH